MTIATPLDDNLKFYVALTAHQDSPPSRGGLLEVLEATGLWQLAPDQGASAQLLMWGEAIVDPPAPGQDLGFRADPIDPALPVVLAFAPRADETQGDVAFAFGSTNGLFGLGETEEAEFSSNQIDCWVVTDDAKLARDALTAVAAFAAPLKLHHSRNSDGRMEEATVDALVASWEAWRSRRDDARAFSRVDGSMRPDRVSGVVQESATVYRGRCQFGSLDLDHAGRVVAFVKEAGEAKLWLQGALIDLPEGSWQDVRWLPDGGLVLIGTRRRGRKSQAAFLTTDGSLRLMTPSPVGRPVVTDTHLVVLTDWDRDLVALTFDGDVVLRYAQDVGGPEEEIGGLRIVHAGGDTVAIYSRYTSSLALLDVTSKKQVVHRLPEPCDFHAISFDAASDTAYFHSRRLSDVTHFPSIYDGSIYQWRLGESVMTEVARFPSPRELVGMWNGKFLAPGTAGFTIVTPNGN